MDDIDHSGVKTGTHPNHVTSFIIKKLGCFATFQLTAQYGVFNMDALSWKTLALVFCILVLGQEVTSVDTGCVERSLVGKNNLNIPDSSFTASSYLYDWYRSMGKTPDDRYAPSNARLNGNWGWSSRDNYDPKDYLQIDLGAVRVITAVATQGNGGGQGRILKEWITKYKLKFKKDTNSKWVQYKDTITIKTPRNMDSDKVERHGFTNPQTARYIRFIPVSYERDKTMRVNVYVIDQEAPHITAKPSERSMQLNWSIKPCEMRLQDITGFIVDVTKKGESVDVGRVTSYNITGLQPYTDYEIRVKAVEYELWSQTMTIKTTVAVPEVSPTIINIVSYSSTSIVLEWKLNKTKLLHGPLTGYRITYIAQGGSTKTVDVGVVNTWTLTSLEKYTWYTITLSVNNTKYVGPPSRRLKIRTMEDAPSSPEHVRNSLIPPQSYVGPRLNITWDKSRDQNGIIRKYTLIYYYNNNNTATRRININASSGRRVIINITMKGLLSFNISASTVKEGPYTTGHVTIPAYPPWAAPTNVSVTLLNTTSIDVSWRPISDDKINCNITVYEVNLTLYETRCNDEILIKRSNIVHIPGRNTHVVMQGLLLCSLYGISVRGYTMAGPGPYSDTVYLNTQDIPSVHKERTAFSRRGFIVGLAVALPLLVVLTVGLIVILIKWRRNRQHKDMAIPLNASDMYSTPNCRRETNPSNPIDYDEDETQYVNIIDICPLSLFDIKFLTPNGNIDECSLKNEFKSISTTPRYGCSRAEKPSNKKKNRYKNIVTYDHSRVVLEDEYEYNDEDSGYINASFMRGYDGSSRTYIATQGPLPDTAKDFWQMIWQQNTATVVMLTNLVELRKTKCHQYWSEGSEQYGDITVTNHKTQVFADYVIRTFLLDKTDKTSRRVRQFHFTAWPDKGVPQHATEILAFRRKVRKETPANAGPTVIHCSAGVGRTGAYIMIDAMLEQTKHQQSLDICSYLQTIREDRPYMVQTEDQYVFVHLAVYEALSCGNTEIEVHNLSTAVKDLSTVDKHRKKTGFVLEFQRLRVLTQKAEEVQEGCTNGLKQENFHKNRYSDVVPVDERRVILSVNNEDEGDYINASFVDTYRNRNAFIVTQAPLKNTVVDFWRMVMDYDIGTIVMLNNLQEGNKIFPQYWPEQEPMICGDITVKSVKVEFLDEVVAREFHVMESGKNLSVLHLQHTSWGDKCIPSNPQSVLHLLNEVERNQQKLAGSSPILVHSSNGVGRSGTFCAIASTLERVKQEQVLDVFQTVKSIRGNRPGAVQTLIQYKFCYTIVKEYLDSFSDYANFKA